MLFYRMTLVPLRLFHNNLSNLQEFFGQVAHPSPPPPSLAKNDSISCQALECSGERFCGL